MKPRLGIQLWSVKEWLKTDFKGTLEALADMGFQGVEFAGNYGDMTPEALADFLKSVGLKCCGLHGREADLLDASSAFYALAKTLESAYVTLSLAGKVGPAWRETFPTLEKIGRVAADKGLIFTYHNHHQEMAEIENQPALDLLFDNTTPAFVKAELDLGWIRKGGGDPMLYLDKYAGRTPQIHLRDFDVANQVVTDVGQGFIDIAAVFAKAEKIGTNWVIYEQDRFPVSALESCRVCATLARPFLSPKA